MKSGTGWGAQVLLVAAAFSLLPMAAEARRTSIDFETDNFPAQGNSWETYSGNVSPGAFPATGSLLVPFGGFSPSALNIGGATFTGFCLLEDGAFSLTQASASCNDSSNALFNVLAGTGLQAFSPDNPTGAGAVFISRGFAADVFDSDGSSVPYDINNSVSALRFTWNNMATSYTDGNPDGAAYFMQAYLYFLGDGNFDLDLRYGIGDLSADPNAAFPAVTRSIIAGGATLFSSNDLIVAERDYFFSFRNGLLVDGTTEPPVSVPEPGTLTLLGSGLLGLALLRRRKLHGQT